MGTIFKCGGFYFSPDVCTYAEDVVCSLVLGDDIISRQGMLMMDDLKIQIIKAINETRLPKVKLKVLPNIPLQSHRCLKNYIGNLCIIGSNTNTDH